MARFIQSWNFMRAHPSLGKRMKAFSLGKRVAELARSPSIRAALRPRKLMHNNGIDAFEVVRDVTAATWRGSRGGPNADVDRHWREQAEAAGLHARKGAEYLEIYRRR
jgi:hypothetical protein